MQTILQRPTCYPSEIFTRDNLTIFAARKLDGAPAKHPPADVTVELADDRDGQEQVMVTGLRPCKPLEPFEYDPGPLSADDVEITVETCGIGHSEASLTLRAGSRPRATMTAAR
jgi:hypothetical protein